MDGFNGVDIAVAVILLLGALSGLRRGLSGELARVISAGLALFAAWHFAPFISDLVLKRSSLTTHSSYITAFLGVLVGSYIVLLAVRIVLRNLMEFAFKGKLERIGGALCGAIRSAVVVTAIVLLASVVPNERFQRAVTQESFAGRMIFAHARPAYEELSERYPELRLPTSEADGLTKALETNDLESDEDYLGPLPVTNAPQE